MNGSVKTRSFLLGDRFWEISWTGLDAEVVSGVVGKAGRAREKSFDSVQALERFVEAECAKTVKKGFAECDPAALTVADVIDPFQKQVEAVSRRVRRDAFVPTTEPGNGTSGASKFGGQPWLLATEASVDCGRCHGPMQLVFQLRRADLPAPWGRLFARDMIQCFLCDRDCQAEDGWMPFARTSLVRHVDTGARGRVKEQVSDLEPFPEKIVRGWTRHDDHPSYEDLEREAPGLDALEVSAALKARGDVTLAGEKLGGWPAWIQSPEHPRCTCGRTMEPFFQVDSNRTLPIQFGDVGIGWAVICPGCRAMTFLWQSG